MAAGHNALHAVLQKFNLLEYEPLLLEEGRERDCIKRIQTHSGRRSAWYWAGERAGQRGRLWRLRCALWDFA